MRSKTVGRTPPDLDQRSRRRLLIALNASLHGNLQAVYRLSNELDAWLGLVSSGDRGEITRCAQALGVPSRLLKAALSLVPSAGRVARREIARCVELGARIVTRLDRDYPPVLLDLELPPPVLYVLGDIGSRPGLSIVGSRRCDPYGLEVARLFSSELAAAGFTVVSGLALGIDAAAHRGALAVRGHTIAVLGCGIDVLYPRANRRLLEEIKRSGAVLTEFPLGATPKPWRFPVRNRIIASLGVGTIIVRATPRSGSLITARYALDLTRDVYAVPGDIFDQRSAGPNSLIRDGAHPVQHPREIIELLEWRSSAPRSGDSLDARFQPLELPADPRLTDVLELLPPSQTIAEEDVLAASSLSVGQTQSALFELEVGGWIKRHPGPRFVRSTRSTCL